VDPEKIKRALAAEVREWRRSRRLSQEKLAELSKLHRNALANVERLKSDPKLKTLVLIADAMKMTLAQLFAAVEGRCARNTGIW
jgi:transcriptional regulator with XRE-family HTH domain